MNSKCGIRRLALVAAVAATTLLTRCAPIDTGGSCAPNVIDTGLQLSVTQLSANTFKFQLCADANPPTVYTVYGASTQNALNSGTINLSAAARSPVHISDASLAGRGFQVTFNSTDDYFAIYEDAAGGYSDSFSMVRPRRLPGR